MAGQNGAANGGQEDHLLAGGDDDGQQGNIDDQLPAQHHPLPPVHQGQPPGQLHGGPAIVHHHYHQPPPGEVSDNPATDEDSEASSGDDDHHPANDSDDPEVQLGRRPPARQRRTRANFDFKAIQPDVFHGLSTEFPTRWIRQFEAYCNTKKISDYQIKALFKLLMRSRAQIWVDSFDKKDTKTWKAVKQAFLQEFESPTAMWHNQNKLDERKLRPDETPDQYINDVLQLTARLYMSKQAQMKALIRGLPPKVKGNVLYHNPTTMNDVIHAIQLAAMCEDMNVSKPSSKSSKSSSKDTDEVQAKLVATCKAVTDHLDDQLQDSTKKLRKMKLTATAEDPDERPARGQRSRGQQPASRYAPAQGGGRSSRGNGRPMRRQTFSRTPTFRQAQGTPRSLRDIECYNCRKKGHMARDCRSRRFEPRSPPQQGAQQSGNGNQPTQWVRVVPVTSWPTQTTSTPQYSIPSAAIEGYQRQENAGSPGQWPALPAPPQATTQITECVMPLN